MMNWKKVVLGAVAGACCLGIGYTSPAYATSDNNAVVQVSDKIEYVKISPEENAFRDKRTGNSMYIVEKLKNNLYQISCVEDAYRDVYKLDEQWRGYKGSRDTIANVGYVNNCMYNVESAYMEEVAKHSVHEVGRIADGVGALPNHSETHYIFNDLNGQRYLAATCEVSNLPGTDFNILGGYKYINGTEVRMRQAPNTDCEILGYFENNEQIYVYGYANVDYNAHLPNGWAYVRRTNGQAGYVSAQFVMRAPVRGI